VKTTVVFTILGQARDAAVNAAANNPDGQEKRPSVAIAMQRDFPVARIEMLHQPGDTELLKTVVSDIESVSPETVVRLNSVSMKDSFDFEEVFKVLYDFCKQYPFNTEQEEYYVSMATGTHVALICLFLLVKSRYIPGQLLQIKPPSVKNHDDKSGSWKVIDLDLAQYDLLMALTVKEQQEATSFLKSGIATRNAAFNDLIDEIEQVVTSRLLQPLRQRSVREKPGSQPSKGGPPPVLLIGATGVGKSQLARRIYELKANRQLLTGQFIEVNCATLRGSHSMSALFGHTKGSYTGATESRAGYLRAADGGMLFLDEIGELGLDEQAMLLRAIEEKRFQPVGSDTDVVSNFQLIAGTNRDLNVEVAAGKFREDLLARINLWTFRLPSLAERREDIEPNIEYELAEYERLHKFKITFNKEARKSFLDFALSHEATWSANVRDLNAAIVRMATLSNDGRIMIETVEREIERLKKQWKKALQETTQGHIDVLERYFDEEQIEKIDHFDRAQLTEVILVCRNSSTLTEAGRRLFQYSRTQKSSSNDASRLQKYLARFGLDWERIKEK
jgi:transcriptional regulatory protein RtcR